MSIEQRIVLLVLGGWVFSKAASTGSDACAGTSDGSCDAAPPAREAMVDDEDSASAGENDIVLMLQTKKEVELGVAKREAVSRTSAAHAIAGSATTNPEAATKSSAPAPGAELRVKTALVDRGESTQSEQSSEAPSDIVDMADGRPAENLQVRDMMSIHPSATVDGNSSLRSVSKLTDFEAVARQRMTAFAFDYYHTAAGDMRAAERNVGIFANVELRPRFLVDVTEANTRCVLLGSPSSLPVFISPAAKAQYGHRDGEVALARAAGQNGVIQTISKLASLPLEEITAARRPGQVQWCQLYVEQDRTVAENYIRRINDAGCSALVLTIDTPIVGKRTNLDYWSASITPDFDASLSWRDLAWLRSLTTLPLVLKGIMTGEDALLAAQHNVSAIIVSNHGGRQLDRDSSTLEALVDVIDALKVAGLSDAMEVYMDGGIRSGGDVYASLALGAKAVGIGRVPMYALAFGEAGVSKALQIVREELEGTMRLMGRRSLAEIRREDVVVPGLCRDV